MYYFPDYEGQYGLVGACAQNESQPMHGMFAFDLTGLKGWPVVGACDAYWSTFDSGVLRVGGFAGSKHYTDEWIGQYFLSCVVSDRTWYEVDACDMFWKDMVGERIGIYCVGGQVGNLLLQLGYHALHNPVLAWYSPVFGACIVMISVGLIRVIHIWEDVVPILVMKVEYSLSIVCVQSIMQVIGLVLIQNK